jgi:hypothetical protein
MLPSIQEIEKIERKRSQAIESLEITDHSVKCQKCGNAKPIVEVEKQQTSKSSRQNKRMTTLYCRIRWIESYSHDNNSNKNDNLKQAKQELEALLEEDAKADKLRSLPLYSCKKTGFKFVCSSCFDKVCSNNRRRL